MPSRSNAAGTKPNLGTTIDTNANINTDTNATIGTNINSTSAKGEACEVQLHNLDNQGKRLQLVNVLLLPESGNELNYRFQSGQLYLIQGQNGAGKSTLLQGLAAIQPIAQGQILIGDQALCRRTWRRQLKWDKQALQQIQYVPQHVEEMWFCGTITQELQLINKQYHEPGEGLSEHLTAALEQFGITDEMYERDLHSLSIGQQKRLALAIAFSLRCEWLLLDEPFAGLDGEGKQLVLQQLALRKQEGKGTLIVSHQLAELMPFIDQNLVLDRQGLAQTAIVDCSMDEAIFQRLLHADNDELAAVKQWNSGDYNSLHERKKLYQTQELHECESFHASGNFRESDDPYRPSELHDPHERDRRISVLPQLFDPRALMLSMLISSSSLFIWNSWLAILLYGALAFSIAMLLRSVFTNWIGIIAGFCLMSAVFAVVGGLSFSPLQFAAQPALLIAQRMLSLLVIIVMGLPLLSLMTPFRLQRALQQVFAPLRKFNLSLDQYALLVSLIFRFVPMLSARWQSLQSLARARFKQTGLYSWHMLSALTLAYVRSMLKLAEQLATSLELRGYDRVKTKPLFHAQVQWQRQDSLLVIVMIGMAALNAAIHLFA